MAGGGNQADTGIIQDCCASIARTLIEQMDGTISAEYEKDRLCICICFSDKTVIL